MNRLLLLALSLLLLSSCSQDNATKIVIETEHGEMTAVLFEETVKHKENFVKLTQEGFFDDLLFHRVIKGFMIQGGDPKSKDAEPSTRLGSGGPGYTIPAEINPKYVHLKGRLSAARQGDQVNPKKESSGSQFYVVQGKPVTDQQLDQMEKMRNFKYTPEQRAAYLKDGGTPMLDMEYTVFGEVVDGLDVIDKIASVQTAPGDRPVLDVRMKIRMK